MKTVVLARDLRVTVWQWPENRNLWGKQLLKGSKAEVVAEEADGAMVCRLQTDHYFVVWPDTVLEVKEMNQQEVLSSQPDFQPAGTVGARAWDKRRHLLQRKP